MFYTNFGACTSIVLVLGMIGIFISEMTTMVDKTKIIQTVTSIPTTRKDNLLDERGGLFLFGYRIVDE